MNERYVKSHFLMTSNILLDSMGFDDLLGGSVGCLSSFVPSQRRDKVTEWDKVDEFTNEFAISKILEAMNAQRIVNYSSSESLDYYDEIASRCDEILLNLPIKGWKIIIDGPKHSGKSTILSILSSKAVKFLSSSPILSKIFVFPINWELCAKQLTDITSLYMEMVARSVALLSWQRGLVFPIARNLQSWLYSIPASPVFPTLPSSLIHYPNFPREPVEAFGIECFKAFHTAESDPLELARTISAIPGALSACFGFSRCLLIYDHIDFCDVTFSTSQETGNSVDLYDIIIKSLSSQLYIVSTKSAPIPPGKLKDGSSQLISVSDSISLSVAKTLPAIALANPTLRITADECRGCPQYIHRYVDVIKRALEIKQIKEDWGEMPFELSVPYDCKMQQLRNSVRQLCSDLFEIPSDLFGEEFVDELQRNDKFTVEVQ